MTKANLERDAPLVLIVDDDRSMRIMAKQALKQGGFRVAEANNGLTALAKVEALASAVSQSSSVSNASLKRPIRSM